MGLRNSPVSEGMIFRGATVVFETTFFDYKDLINLPTQAFVEITFPDVNGNPQTMQIQMLNPTAPDTLYLAELDTRNMGTGPVYWSIHSAAPVPVAVEDGSFVLTANPANLTTF